MCLLLCRSDRLLTRSSLIVQNFAAVMSVSEDLLCSFELLKVWTPCRCFSSACTDFAFFHQPLNSADLKKEMTKAKRKRYVWISLGSCAHADVIRLFCLLSLQQHQSPPNTQVAQTF